MKTFIVYDSTGTERGYIKASGHNAAEKKVITMFGARSSVAGTELGKEFDHCSGFFTDADAKAK
jgi:hypothetical protein